MNSNLQIMFKKVWLFTWPAILSNISMPILGLVDTAILGHLGNAKFLGGVAVANSVLLTLISIFGFLRMGTTGVVAQAYGRQHIQNIQSGLIQAVVLAGSMGLILLLLMPWVVSPILTLFYTSDEVMIEALKYFGIRIYSMPAVLINYAIVGWCIGMHRPKGPLLMLVVANILNAILDVFFILVLDMEVKGAALATVIADYISLAIGFFVVTKIWHVQCLGVLSKRALYNRVIFNRLIFLNKHLFIRTLSLLFVFMFFTSQGGKLGDVYLTANALLLSLLVFISSSLDGFAHAAEAITGQALGANKLKTFYLATKVTGWCSILLALILALVFLVAGHIIIHLLTDLKEVTDYAMIYLPWLVMMPLITVWCYWLDGIFIGAMRMDMMQYSMIFALFLVYFPVWYLTQSWHNHGLWLAFSSFMLMRGLSLGVIYYYLTKQKKWLVNRVC